MALSTWPTERQQLRAASSPCVGSLAASGKEQGMPELKSCRKGQRTQPSPAVSPGRDSPKMSQATRGSRSSPFSVLSMGMSTEKGWGRGELPAGQPCGPALSLTLLQQLLQVSTTLECDTTRAIFHLLGWGGRPLCHVYVGIKDKWQDRRFGKAAGQQGLQLCLEESYNREGLERLQDSKSCSLA